MIFGYHINHKNFVLVFVVYPGACFKFHDIIFTFGIYRISQPKILTLAILKDKMNKTCLKKELWPKSLKCYCAGVYKGIPQI